ncbi:MAG TPA: sigma-70 family RNA polymerase sigma factor [Planctomycetota bacterium]|nr:sigma-70 family RNA polymerase sigma factor [Planctomycetota bacterium]
MALGPEEIVRTLLGARTRISGSIWMVTRDVQAAEDIFQNVSVKALSEGPHFEGPPQLISWARIVARNEALNWIRDRKGKEGSLKEVALDLVDQEWDEEARQGREGERAQAVRGCLEGLSRESRRILELRYAEGRSSGEISRETGVRLEAVYQRLSRLHRALKRCTEERLAGQGTARPALEGP